MASKRDKKKKDLAEIRVILIGKTGAGKSFLANALLRSKIFESSPHALSETTNCAFGKRKIKSKSRKYMLKVIDTPGLKDNRLPEEKTCAELVKCISLTLPGPHFFVIVVPIGRFTEEEFEVVEMLKREFGEELMNFALVVFTHVFKLNGVTLDEYVEKAPDSLKQIIEESGNRYGAIGSKGDKKFKKSVQNIIDLIIDSLDFRFYSNDMFKQADENKQMIVARTENERNCKMKELQEEMERLTKILRVNRNKEKQREIKEEKRRKEEELKKIQNTSPEEMYDYKIATDDSVIVQDTYQGTLFTAFGGMVQTGVGVFTRNAALAGQGMMTAAKSLMDLFN